MIIAINMVGDRLQTPAAEHDVKKAVASLLAQFLTLEVRFKPDAQG